MLKIDDNFLNDIGLANLQEQEKKKRLAQLLQTLQDRVGLRIASELSEQQLRDFEKVQKDEVASVEWLKSNFPSYESIIQEEINKLKDEINTKADAALDAMSEDT